MADYLYNPEESNTEDYIEELDFDTDYTDEDAALYFN